MINALLSRPRRLLATLALLLAATGVAIGSGASFTSSSATAANTFATGTLKQTNDKDGAAILTAANMKPGDTTTGTVKITNSGSLAGTFKVAETDYAKTFEKTTLALSVVDTASGTSVYSGKLDGFGTKDLGTWAAGEAHTYKFTVTFPTTDDSGATDQNVDQGKTASAKFAWTSTQTAGRDLTNDSVGASNGAN